MSTRQRKSPSSICHVAHYDQRGIIKRRSDLASRSRFRFSHLSSIGFDPTRSLSIFTVIGESLHEYMHYEKDGSRIGPVSDEDMRVLIQQRAIAASTLVWKQGFADWSPLAGTALAAHLATSSTPPALPATRISNVVWFLALAPLIGMIMEAMIADALAPTDELSELAGQFAIRTGPSWWISLALNIALMCARRTASQTRGRGHVPVRQDRLYRAGLSLETGHSAQSDTGLLLDLDRAVQRDAAGGCLRGGHFTRSPPIASRTSRIDGACRQVRRRL